MTTGNTTLLGLALPVEGELDGTWGDVVNDSITSLVDSAVAGTTTLSADADVTLTTTALSANQARQAIILWTASNGATTRNVTAPAQSKPYIVINAGTGSIVLRGAGPTTGVTIIAGEKCLAAWNGSDFVKVATSNTATGTVTAVSVASANGLAGTSSGGATPELTLSTSVTGLVKGDGTELSAATAGTDYVAPGTATTFTATQTFSGTSTALAMVFSDAAEVVTVSSTMAAGIISYDVTTQSVLYYTATASANWIVNFRGSMALGGSLNSILATGQSVTVAFLVTQGPTAYYNNQIQIDGSVVNNTVRWLGGAPASGNPDGVDSYRYLIVKVADNTFDVFASVTQFKV
jgi:hypothetical protein